MFSVFANNSIQASTWRQWHGKLHLNRKTASVSTRWVDENRRGKGTERDRKRETTTKQHCTVSCSFESRSKKYNFQSPSLLSLLILFILYSTQRYFCFNNLLPWSTGMTYVPQKRASKLYASNKAEQKHLCKSVNIF